MDDINETSKGNPATGNAGGEDSSMKCPKCGGRMEKTGDKWVCKYCHHEMPV